MNFSILISNISTVAHDFAQNLRRAISLARRVVDVKRVNKILNDVEGEVLVNLGCGNNPLNGWINLDACTIDGVICWDLRKGIPLANNSVDYVFSEHFVEHLTFDQAVQMFEEIYRVLKPNGVVRTAMPCLSYLIKQYQSKDWKNQSWIAGEYVSLQTPAQMLNTALRDWGHQWVYDFEEAQRLVQIAGFSICSSVGFGESNHEILKGLETRKDSRLIFECVKTT